MFSFNNIIPVFPCGLVTWSNILNHPTLKIFLFRYISFFNPSELIIEKKVRHLNVP